MNMVRSLGLSDAQKTQIKTMVQQYREEHPKGSAQDKQARKALRRQVLGILTPQQRDQLQEERRQHHSEQQPGGFAPTPTPLPEETGQP
jgi:Spy/CpxP family protein refolding chaperone